jgi:hypothetical protein
MGYRIGNEWRPDLNMGAGALEEGFAAMGTDALLAGRPIHQKIDKTSQVDAAFDSITYGKGGHVVAMIAAFMGDTKFRDGVRGYMAAHRYGNASSDEFFAAMATASGDPRILPAMKSFTDQQGVPLVTFTGSNGQYTVTQSRYARLGTQAPAQTWGVPLCVRRGDARVCQLLDTVSGTVQVGGTGALIPNAGGTGYYRFELPKAEWDGLIAQSASLTGGEGLALADCCAPASWPGGPARRSWPSWPGDVKEPRFLCRRRGHGRVASPRHWTCSMTKATTAYRALSASSRRNWPPMASIPLGAYAGEAAEHSQRRVQLVSEMVGVAQDKATTATLVKAARLAGRCEGAGPQLVWHGLQRLSGRTCQGRGRRLETAKMLFNRALATQDPLVRPAMLGALRSVGQGQDRGMDSGRCQGSAPARHRASGLVLGVASNSATRQMGYDWVRDHRQAAARRWRHFRGPASANGLFEHVLGRRGAGHRPRFRRETGGPDRPAGAGAHDRAGQGLRLAQDRSGQGSFDGDFEAEVTGSPSGRKRQPKRATNPATTPSPSMRLASSSVPPCCSAIARASVRPSPPRPYACCAKARRA